MKLKEEDYRFIKNELNEYLNHPEVQKMKGYVAHGRKTLYSHCLSVVITAYKINRQFKLNANEHTLLVGALLHDLYLYDWHDYPLNWNIFKMHGFTHPEAARKNAERIFNVDEDIQNVIKSHMWPLTLRSYPKSREAAIVCLADKLVATRETLRR